MLRHRAALMARRGCSCSMSRRWELAPVLVEQIFATIDFINRRTTCC